MANLLKNSSFEDGTTGDFSTETDANGDLNVLALEPAVGSWAADLNVNDNDQLDVQWNYNFGNLGKLYLGYWIKVANHTPTTAPSLRFITGTWQIYHYFRWTTGGTWQMVFQAYGVTSGWFTPTVAYDDDTWHHYEIFAQNGVNACWFKVDGTTEASFNSSNTGTINRLRIGNHGTYDGPPTWSMKLDGIELWDDEPTASEKLYGVQNRRRVLCIGS